jgi:hypothetical protein
MFGRNRKAPANTPFGHADRCKTKDAEPEWYDSGDGRWQRTCSCGDEFREKASGELEPTSAAAQPAKHAHLHAPQFEGSGVDALVMVEFSTPDRAWRSHCMACTTTYLYCYAPRYVEEGDDGELYSVTRRGNCLFDYPLASEQVVPA